MKPRAAHAVLLFFSGFILAHPAKAQTAQNSGIPTVPTTVSFPYPKWFWDRSASTPNKLLFRMFGYEGMARNLFVLNCYRNASKPAQVELIPPKGIEERLRTSASARESHTSIDFSRDGLSVYQMQGRYDKIATFADIHSEKELFKFLQLFQADTLLVRWNQAKIEYLLRTEPIYTKQFSETFGARLLEMQNEELSYQDVYIRCSGLWER